MHRIDGPGHANGQFVNEDVATSRAPTQVTPEWLNAVQEELEAPILDAGMVLDKGNNGQLLAAIRRLIRNDLGGFSGRMEAYGTQPLAPGSVGKVVSVGGGSAGDVITLPFAGAVPPGSCIAIECGQQSVVIHAAAGDTIAGINGLMDSVDLVPDTSLVLESNAAGAWTAIGGSAQVMRSGLSASSLGVSGYKKYIDATSPTGFFIEQWGSAYGSTGPGVGVGGSVNIFVTLPITFPNAVLNVQVTGNNNNLLSNAQEGVFAWEARTLSTLLIKYGSFVNNGPNEVVGCDYRAIGF